MRGEDPINRGPATVYADGSRLGEATSVEFTEIPLEVQRYQGSFAASHEAEFAMGVEFDRMRDHMRDQTVHRLRQDVLAEHPRFVDLTATWEQPSSPWDHWKVRHPRLRRLLCLSAPARTRHRMTTCVELTRLLPDLPAGTRSILKARDPETFELLP